MNQPYDSSSTETGHITYWAADRDPDAAAKAAHERFQNHARAMNQSGLSQLIEKAYYRYYGKGNVGKSHGMSPGGERGELTMIYANELRNLATHLLTIVTGQRVAYNVGQKNNSVDARKSAIVGQEILMGSRKEKNLDDVFHSAAELALVTSESYVRVDWDQSLGEEVAVAEDGRLIHDGDVRVDAFSVWNVACERNSSRRSSTRPRWFVVREHVNKYDLAARFPDLASEIVASETSAQAYKHPFPSLSRSFFGFSQLSLDEDLVPLYTFYHQKTPALPAGRELVYIGNGTPLLDGPLSYKTIPIYILSPGRVMESGYNYTPVFDSLGPLDAMNSLLSVGLSNSMTYGTQNIIAPRGSGVKSTKLSSGHNLLEYDIGAPEPLPPVQSPPEIYTGIELYRSLVSTYMGISPITRGEVPEKMSGTAMALSDSKSLQFSNFFQMKIVLLIEAVGQAILDVYASRVQSPRFIEAISPDKRSMLKSFVGSDLSGVGKVTIELANPMMQTFAGRYDMADKFLERGLVRTPEQYAEVIDTGTIEPIMKGPREENLYIEEENEAMRNGVTPNVLATDSDPLHIMGHVCVVNSGDAREDPVIMKAALDHIMAHVVSMATKNPILAMALGQNLPQLAQQAGAVQAGAPDGQPPDPNQPPVEGVPGAQNANLPQPAQPPQQNGE